MWGLAGNCICSQQIYLPPNFCAKTFVYGPFNTGIFLESAGSSGGVSAILAVRAVGGTVHKTMCNSSPILDGTKTTRWRTRTLKALNQGACLSDIEDVPVFYISIARCGFAFLLPLGLFSNRYSSLTIFFDSFLTCALQARKRLRLAHRIPEYFYSASRLPTTRGAVDAEFEVLNKTRRASFCYIQRYNVVLPLITALKRPLR